MRRIFLVIILSLLFVCSTKPYVVKHNARTSSDKLKEIYVVSHGWHTGLIVSAKEIQSRIPRLKERFGDISYIEFGWGDKGFYNAKEITIGLTLMAIFWPTESVIHAVAVPNDVTNYFPNSEIENLYLTEAEHSSLLSFISNSFYKDQNGEIFELNNGIYGNSQFYKSVGDYYLMNTCNNWTAKGLKSAGMDISPRFKLTASSVMDYIQGRNQCF